MKQLKVRDLERMNLGKRYWAARLDRLPDIADGEPLAFVKVVKGFVASMDEMFSKGIGILIWGANGVGKTYAMSALAKEVAKTGRSVMLVTSDVLKDEHTSFGEGLIIDGQPLVERARYVDFLVVDDLGKEWRASSGFAEQILQNLMRIRAREKRVTSFTTNMNPNRIEEVFGPSMASLLREMVIPVQARGVDIRQKLLRDVGRRLSDETG